MTSGTLKARLARKFLNGRLGYYFDVAQPDFWDNHWRKSVDPKAFASSAQGKLVSYYENPFMRWLPRTGRILEAGCGLGHHVIALRARGFDVVGIDVAEDAIRIAKDHRPDLPISVGDALHLDAPNGSYAAYISLGVIEHREAGPEPFLREAYRGLAAGGIAIFTVPWINVPRRWKARMDFYRARQERLHFYQYAFATEEIALLLRQAGFTVQHIETFDPIKGLKDEIRILATIMNWPYIGWRIKAGLLALFRAYPGLGQHFGHMILIVARKPLPSDPVVPGSASA